MRAVEPEHLKGAFFMKKILSILAAAAIALSCAGCNNAGGGKKTLKVGSDVSYPPFEYMDTDGNSPIGIDMDLAKALGEKMGYEIEIVDTSWDGVFSGLDNGNYDIVMSAVTITPDRLESYIFSDPYIENWQSIVVMSDAAKKPASPEELAGLKVGYLQESTSDVYLTEFIAKNNISVETFEYGTVMNAYEDLAAGRLDAVISDSTVTKRYIADPKFTQTWLQTEGEPELFGVCIPKDKTALRDEINKALKELKADGTLDKIINTYF